MAAMTACLTVCLQTGPQEVLLNTRWPRLRDARAGMPMAVVTETAGAAAVEVAGGCVQEHIVIYGIL